MAEFDLLCPTCHSRIGDTEEEIIGIAQGSLGTDENGLPVPKWTDDPIRTSPRGFSGEDFRGADRIKGIHIRELQEVRALEEIEVGIANEFLTDFSEIDGNNVRVLHIVELRESVEKILNVLGSGLSTFFSVDPDQDPIEPGPNDEAKDEWTDIDRGRPYIHKDGIVIGTFLLPNSENEEDVTDSPTLPENTAIRAIHIEDLRHTVPGTIFFEYYSVTPSILFEANLPEDRDPPGIEGVRIFIRKIIFPTDLQIRTTATTEQIQEALDLENPPEDNILLHGPVNFDAIDEDQGWWRLSMLEKTDKTFEKSFPSDSCPNPAQISAEFTTFTDTKFETLSGVTLLGEPKPKDKAALNQIVKLTSLASSIAVGDFAALDPTLFSCNGTVQSSDVRSAIGLEGNVAPVEPDSRLVFISDPFFNPETGSLDSSIALKPLHDDVNFPGLSKPTFSLTDKALFKWYQDSDVTITEELEDYSFGDTSGLQGQLGLDCAGKTEIEDPSLSGSFDLSLQIRMNRAAFTLPIDPSTPQTSVNTRTKELNITIKFYQNVEELEDRFRLSLPDDSQVRQIVDGYTFISPRVYNPTIKFGRDLSSPGFPATFLQPILAVFLDDLSSPLGGPNFEIDFKRMLEAWVQAVPELAKPVINEEIDGIGEPEAYQSLYVSQELAESTAGSDTPLSATIANLDTIKLFIETNYSIHLFQFSGGSACNRAILGRIRHGDIKVETSLTGFRVENRPEE